MTPTKLVVSTRNQHKLDEIHAIMSVLPIQLLSLDAFPGAPEVVEDADTLEGNAAKKSEQLFQFTQLPTFADDTGLEVSALNGAPGVYSARYAGISSSDEQNRAHLLSEMKGFTNREAQFRTAIAFTTSSGTFVFEGACKGKIAESELGQHGFGYDSLFIPDGFEQSFAEMDPALKNSISHRSRALHRFTSYLSGMVGSTL